MSLHIAHLRIFFESTIFVRGIEHRLKKIQHKHNDFFLRFHKFISADLNWCNFFFGESILFELYIESGSTRSNENNFCFVQNRLLTWFFGYCLKKFVKWKIKMNVFSASANIWNKNWKNNILRIFLLWFTMILRRMENRLCNSMKLEWVWCFQQCNISTFQHFISLLSTLKTTETFSFKLLSVGKEFMCKRKIWKVFHSFCACK